MKSKTGKATFLFFFIKKYLGQSTNYQINNRYRYPLLLRHKAHTQNPQRGIHYYRSAHQQNNIPQQKKHNTFH